MKLYKIGQQNLFFHLDERKIIIGLHAYLYQLSTSTLKKKLTISCLLRC